MSTLLAPPVTSRATSCSRSVNVPSPPSLPLGPRRQVRTPSRRSSCSMSCCSVRAPMPSARSRASWKIEDARTESVPTTRRARSIRAHTASSIDSIRSAPATRSSRRPSPADPGEASEARARSCCHIWSAPSGLRPRPADSIHLPASVSAPIRASVSTPKSRNSSAQRMHPTATASARPDCSLERISSVAFSPSRRASHRVIVACRPIR